VLAAVDGQVAVRPDPAPVHDRPARGAREITLEASEEQRPVLVAHVRPSAQRLEGVAAEHAGRMQEIEVQGRPRKDRVRRAIATLDGPELDVIPPREGQIAAAFQ
jgi:hypothetical protein